MEKYYNSVNKKDSIMYFIIGLVAILCSIIALGPGKNSVKNWGFGYVFGIMGIILIVIAIKKFFKKNALKNIEQYAEAHKFSIEDIKRDFICAKKYDSRVRMGERLIFYIDGLANGAVISKEGIQKAEFNTSLKSVYGTLHVFTNDNEHYEIPIKYKGYMKIRQELFGER